MKPNYQSLTALLGNSIDFAGTFPPASLSFGDTLKASCRFRREGRFPWLMGRITCTLADLRTVNPKLLYESGGDGSPWVFTVLGSVPTEPVGSVADFVRQVEWDLREILRFNERGFSAPVKQMVVGYETKVPSFHEAGGDAKNWKASLEPVLERFGSLSGDAIELCLESGWEGNWEKQLLALSEAMAFWKEESSSSLRLGLKVRTGGKKVPTPEELAEWIVAACQYGLRFKATQGLHHAVSGADGLGYLNLFFSLSAALSFGTELFGKREISACLSETRLKNFNISPQQIGWDKFDLDVERIEAARRRVGGVFGSCSVDEPDEELEKLMKEV